MPIRSDARGNLIKKSQYKKKKYRYWFKYGDENIVGATDGPRRTLESIWKVYWDCKKDICVDLGTRNKIKELCVTQGKETVNTYCNDEITVHKFKQILDEH